MWVRLENNGYKMWYSGFGGDGWRIGYATSTQTPPSERLVFLPHVYGLPGDTTNVILYSDPIEKVSGGDFVIRFDPEILAAFEAQTTDFTKHFIVAANLDTPGVARLALASAEATKGGLGGLVNIRMVVNPALVVPDTTLTSRLFLVSASLRDENGERLPARRRSGLFMLGSSRGDVNGDGLIDSADAILTLRIAAGLLQPTPDQFAEADVDGNGRVESIDASCILRRAVGLDCPSGGNVAFAAPLIIAPFSANARDEIETQIFIDKPEQLLSGDVTLRFEASMLEVTEIRPGNKMAGVAFVANLNGNSHATFCFASSSSFQAQAIAVVRLRAKTSIDQRHLRLGETAFFDSQGRRWNGVITGVVESPAPASPTAFRLKQNYPNPFLHPQAGLSVSATQIHYALPQRNHVKLIIYDVHGRQVRLLEDSEKIPGDYFVAWDGRDDKKIPVAAGLYVYRLQAGENVLTKKMLVLE